MKPIDLITKIDELADKAERANYSFKVHDHVLRKLALPLNASFWQQIISIIKDVRYGTH